MPPNQSNGSSLHNLLRVLRQNHYLIMSNDWVVSDFSKLLHNNQIDTKYIDKLFYQYKTNQFVFVLLDMGILFLLILSKKEYWFIISIENDLFLKIQCYVVIPKEKELFKKLYMHMFVKFINKRKFIIILCTTNDLKDPI